MPMRTETESYRSYIFAAYGLLGDVFAVADGRKLCLEQAGDRVIKEMFFNSWKNDQ